MDETHFENMELEDEQVEPDGDLDGIDRAEMLDAQGANEE
jgi:hypothetical protein